MMKILLLFLFLITSSEGYCDEFFLTYDNFLISGVNKALYPDKVPAFLKTKAKSPWRKMKLEELNSLGLHKGDVVKFVNLKTGILQDYILKDEVNVLLIPNGSYNPQSTKSYYRSYYILLSDQIPNTDLANVSSIDNADTVNGIAYVGSSFQIKSGKSETIKLKDLISKIPDEKTKKYFLNDLTENSGDDFSTVPVIEGATWSIFIEDDGMHACKSLIFYKNNKLEEYQLNCDSGGC